MQVDFARECSRHFVVQKILGRTVELEALSELLNNGPRVVFLHGIAGVGKSAPLSVFAERARAQGTSVIELDCRAIEPTEREFLIALRTSVGGPIAFNYVVLAQDSDRLVKS
jgi:predicted alpha/beta-fold hydrolase